LCFTTDALLSAFPRPFKILPVQNRRLIFGPAAHFFSLVFNVNVYIIAVAMWAGLPVHGNVKLTDGASTVLSDGLVVFSALHVRFHGGAGFLQLVLQRGRLFAVTRSSPIIGGGGLCPASSAALYPRQPVTDLHIFLFCASAFQPSRTQKQNNMECVAADSQM
jgi:hypothetical protein